MVDCMDIVSYKIYGTRKRYNGEVHTRYDVARCKGMTQDVVATSFNHESAIRLMNDAATRDRVNGETVVIDRV